MLQVSSASPHSALIQPSPNHPSSSRGIVLLLLQAPPEKQTKPLAPAPPDWTPDGGGGGGAPLARRREKFRTPKINSYRFFWPKRCASKNHGNSLQKNGGFARKLIVGADDTFWPHTGWGSSFGTDGALSATLCRRMATGSMAAVPSASTASTISPPRP